MKFFKMNSTSKRGSPLRGQSLFVFTILAIGIGGIAAQVVLLRELLVSFYGNELSLGIILANWIIAEAAGVFIIGRVIDRAGKKADIFVFIQAVFLLSFLLSVYLARSAKLILGIPIGEGIGLSAIFYVSLLIMLPSGFCHGALFSSACKVYSEYRKGAADSIARVYALEVVGTIIGGVLLTYILIPRFDSFQIAFIISAITIIASLFFLRRVSAGLRCLVIFLALLMAFLPLSGALEGMRALSMRKQWRGEGLVDYRNSIYGNIAVTQKEGERTFFYNGLPVITAPNPDLTFIEEYGNLPLLFHPAPKEVLIIGAGAGGLINEALAHPVSSIDYAELDPLLISMVKEYSSELTERELGDSRVRVINKDGRFFLKRAQKRYDIIIIGISRPSDLSSNRLFTKEFFELAGKRMRAGGILALYMPGSLTYMDSRLRDLNACVLNGLKEVYGSVRVIPGDNNIFLASDSAALMKVDPGLLVERMENGGINSSILIPAYLEYRLNEGHLEWFTRSIAGATRKINRDFAPVAVYEMLALWNEQFSRAFSGAMGIAEKIDTRMVAGAILALTAILAMALSFRRGLFALSVPYAVATTGFFGMMMNLMLIFSFQVVYGYLYHIIGLLISIFMAGSAAGSMLMARYARKVKGGVGLLIIFEVMMVIFSYLTAAAVSGLSAPAAPLFIILFFISGLFIGLEFPLATGIYLKDEGRVGFASGLFYFSDLMGGWLAGMAGAAIFIPLLGLFNTCIVVICVKLSSLFLLVIFRKRLTKQMI
ncbi:MAG: hypothetical protein WC301_06940 [Candidatus Omnitrophota bacterium]|jgi:spermidine synthase